MTFKIKYHQAGGHIHCSLFAAKAGNQTYAKCGDFVVRNEELPALRIAMGGISFEERQL